MALRKYEAPTVDRLVCDLCDEPCAFVRVSQSQRNRLYCQEHALAEPDCLFLLSGEWQTVQQYLGVAQ
jgi:hypothetical protein